MTCSGPVEKKTEKKARLFFSDQTLSASREYRKVSGCGGSALTLSASRVYHKRFSAYWPMSDKIRKKRSDLMAEAIFRMQFLSLWRSICIGVCGGLCFPGTHLVFNQSFLYEHV